MVNVVITLPHGIDIEALAAGQRQEPGSLECRGLWTTRRDLTRGNWVTNQRARTENEQPVTLFHTGLKRERCETRAECNR